MNPGQNTTQVAAQAMDAADGLRSFRDAFYVQPNTYYMDGNSLGLLSKPAEAALQRMVEAWKKHGIDGWTAAEEPWYDMAERLAHAMAPLLGARPQETIVTSSTTTNLHQILATFYRPQQGRTKILVDALTFPSDLYAVQSQLHMHGLDPADHMVVVQSHDGRTLSTEAVQAQLSAEVAVAVLPTVLYRSGQLLDVRGVTKLVHEVGAVIAWDACHSAGLIPHHFHDDDVDAAFWCTYKYLNAGPGAVGAMFVHERHFGQSPGLAGWFSSDKTKQFDMDTTLQVAPDAGAFQIGTPHVLSMAPLAGSLELFTAAGIEPLRAKSLALTQYLFDLVDTQLTDFNFTVGTPRADANRGGHVSLEHEEAVRICAALKERGVIPDFRFPNIIRLAPVPLYTGFEDVWHTIDILVDIMTHRTYEKFDKKRGVVA